MAKIDKGFIALAHPYSDPVHFILPEIDNDLEMTVDHGIAVPHNMKDNYFTRKTYLIQAIFQLAMENDDT